MGSNQADYFKSILDKLLEGCQIIGFDWRYLYVNDSVARQAHKEKSELIGQKFVDVNPGIENTPLFKILNQCMETHSPDKMINEFVYSGGSKGWFELSIQPIADGLLILSLDITEHKKSEKQIESQYRCLASLRAIDLAILGTTDMRLAFKTILEETKARLEVDIVQIELFNSHTLMLESIAVIGNRSRAMEHISVHLGEGIGGKAALERCTVSIPNLVDTLYTGPLGSVMVKEDACAAYSTPLLSKGILIGVLNVILRSPFFASHEWLIFFETLAGQTAMVIANGKANEKLLKNNFDMKMAYDNTIEGWSRALDLRDKETEGHTQRVTEFTLKLASLSGIEEEELVHVRRGALLHDIGKMGIPDSILLKQDKLSDEEWVIMKKHPLYAYDLLSPIAYLRPALDIPYYHHEKWDGTGYPNGKKGEEIPLVARLFAVVDVWDALRSDRPYRQAWSEEKVYKHIRSLAGTHFDPKAVGLFFNCVNDSQMSDKHNSEMGENAA